MDIFISWSGDRSKELAKALAELLPDVIQDVKAWMSDHDIGAGSRWSHELTQQLESSNFGIICLTPENLSAPWVLFEAGSLAKSVTASRVVPYRLSLESTDVPYPLAQFQGVDANETGTKRLVDELNNACNNPIDAERLNRVFHRWWPDLQARIETISKTSVQQQQPSRTDRALIEEILELTRELRTGKSGKEPNKEAFTDNAVPKTAVWKTIHDVKEVDLKRMTEEELYSYIDTVKKRDLVTPHDGEETALFHLENKAKAELSSRKSEERKSES